jgi:hypothetical protein
MVRVRDRIFIYPVPVIKNKKYLIEVSSENLAQQMIKDLENGSVKSPDENMENLEEIGLHTDQQTKIYQFKDN